MQAHPFLLLSRPLYTEHFHRDGLHPNESHSAQESTSAQAIRQGFGAPNKNTKTFHTILFLPHLRIGTTQFQQEVSLRMGRFSLISTANPHIEYVPTSY